MIYARGLGIHKKRAILQFDRITTSDAGNGVIGNVMFDQNVNGFDKLMKHLDWRDRAKIHASDGFEFGGEVVNWCFHNVEERLLTRLFYHI